MDIGFKFTTILPTLMSKYLRFIDICSIFKFTKVFTLFKRDLPSIAPVRLQKINSYFRCKKLRNCTIWRERIFCIHSFAVCIHKYIEWISYTLYAFIHVQKVCMQQMNAFIYKLQNWSFLGFTAFKQANNSFLRLFRPQNGLSVNLLIFMLCKLTRVANSPDTRGKYNNRLAL